MTRTVRGEFLPLKDSNFVEAAKSLGASGIRVIFHHIIPIARASWELKRFELVFLYSPLDLRKVRVDLEGFHAGRMGDKKTQNFNINISNQLFRIGACKVYLK